MIKAITYNDTFDPGYYRYLKTAQQHGYCVVNARRRDGGKWPGFFGRWEFILKAIEDIDDEEVILVSDSSDVVFLRSLTEKEIAEIKESELIFAAKHTPLPYLKRFFGYNAGTLIAKCGIIKGLASHIIESGQKELFGDCDQSFINDSVMKKELFLKESKLITLNDFSVRFSFNPAVYHHVGSGDIFNLFTKIKLRTLGFTDLSDIKLNLKKYFQYCKKYLTIENRVRNSKNV